MVVTVERILDSNARDKQLRAFAYLEARFSTGAQNAIDCLLPFILYSLAEQENEQFDEHAIIKHVEANYGIAMPFYMVEEMRPKLRQLGAIDNKNIANLDICKNISDRDEAKDKGLDIQLEEIAEIGSNLAEFGAGKGVPTPFSCDSWDDALIRFFQSESKEIPTKSAKIKDVLVLDAGALDNKVVSEYILRCSQYDPPRYEIIQKVYYGVLVADFLTSLWVTGNRQEYKDLEVFYDATILMRLLGTSGKQLRIATLELHDTLTHLGCRTFYFDHTLDELLSNIEAVIQADRYGGGMHPETSAALGSGELEIGTLNLMKAEADFRLGELGVTQHEASYTGMRRQDRLQIDEAEFAELLHSGRRTRKGLETWQKDAISLALLVRLRRGKTTRDVSKCGCIFVTANRYLVSKARRFLTENRVIAQRDVGPMLTVGQMTTVAWLADDVHFEKNRVSKELVANCYRASMPTVGWDEAFWDSLNKGNSSEVKSRLENAIFVEGARRIAMDESFGQATLVPKLNLANIMRRAEKEAERMESTARTSGENLGRQYSHSMIVKRAKNRCRNIAERVVRGIVYAVFLVCALALLLAYLPQNILAYLPQNIIGIQLGVFGSLVSLVLSIISVLELLKIHSIHRLFVKLEDWLSIALYELLYSKTLEQREPLS